MKEESEMKGECRGSRKGRAGAWWTSQVCCSPKHVHSTHMHSEENIFIFLSVSWSISDCCNHIRSDWSPQASLLVRSQHSSQRKILAPRCSRNFVFQTQECQLPDGKWCIPSSEQHMGLTSNLERVSLNLGPFRADASPSNEGFAQSRSGMRVVCEPTTPNKPYCWIVTSTNVSDSCPNPRWVRARWASD